MTSWYSSTESLKLEGFADSTADARRKKKPPAIEMKIARVLTQTGGNDFEYQFQRNKVSCLIEIDSPPFVAKIKYWKTLVDKVPVSDLALLAVLCLEAIVLFF